MLRFTKCPCCDSSKFFPVFINNSPRTIESWRQFFYGDCSFIKDIYECLNCSFRFINQITTGYKKYYGNQDCQLYSESSQFRQEYFRDIKRHLEKRLSIKLSTPSNILDIGCASGDWLQLWEESASLYGTELSPVFHEELANKGIQVVHPEIIEFKKYDLISMFDYLEHVECPEAELSRAYRNLKMGGYLVIGVPDMGKWQARLFGIKYYLYCPMHFSYFNRISLEKITSKIFLKKSISIFQSPPMKTNINGILKWLGFNHPLSYWSSINFPLGYSASLILVARKEA